MLSFYYYFIIAMYSILNETDTLELEVELVNCSCIIAVVLGKITFTVLL